MTGTLKEAREAVAKGNAAKGKNMQLDEENLSVVEKDSSASGLNTYAQASPDGQKSLVSAHMQSKSHDSQMDAMLNAFQHNQSQNEEGQSFVNKEGELESANEELDPNQIDLENLNESELLALQN